MTGRSRNHVLLYDRDWGFCKWSLDKIRAWDRGGRLRPVPIYGEEEKRLLAAMDREARARLLAPRDARAPSALRRRRRRTARAAAPRRHALGLRLRRIDAGCELKRRWWP